MSAPAKKAVLCTHPAFAALCAIAEGKLQAYSDDLFVHDANFLNRLEASTPFVWLVRQCGTHLFVTTGNEAPAKGHYGKAHTANLASSLAEQVDAGFCDPRESRGYAYWDGSRLRVVQTIATLAELAREDERAEDAARSRTARGTR